MRPKKGEELNCRAIVRYLELLDHSLTLDDKQGPSITKEELGKEKRANLDEYNLKCNETPVNSKLF